MFKEVNTGEANKLINSLKKFMILDVRTSEEFSEGHLKNAVNIDIFGLNFRHELNKLDKSMVYIVHCRSGQRSYDAVQIMKELGFTNIFHMCDGMLGWEGNGLPIMQ
ncbi:MAG: rhodanese-like domain-containing protein [Nanoarchaeota archaeon]|nr:rhodanese-like domain-containing protein [Nanoarchaeota archaeon]